MSHAHHESLPGYSPNQILFDGCPECAQRSTDADHGLSYLDGASIRRATKRARALLDGPVPDMSNTEYPLLFMIASVLVNIDAIIKPVLA